MAHTSMGEGYIQSFRKTQKLWRKLIKQQQVRLCFEQEHNRSHKQLTTRSTQQIAHKSRITLLVMKPSASVSYFANNAAMRLRRPTIDCSHCTIIHYTTNNNTTHLELELCCSIDQKLWLSVVFLVIYA